MKAIKEIYAVTYHPLSPEYTEIIAFETPVKDSTKYIRADLAELTWEDMKRINDLCYLEFDQYPETNLPPREKIYKDVLRKFKEMRNNG